MCKHKIKLVLLGNRVSEEYYNFCRNLPGWENVKYYKNGSNDLLKTEAELCFAGLGANGQKIEHLSNVKDYEYMALGLPIIHAKNAVSEIFINNNNHPLGLCVDSDPQAIADAIDYLYENKEVASAMV